MSNSVCELISGWVFLRNAVSASESTSPLCTTRSVKPSLWLYAVLSEDAFPFSLTILNTQIIRS